MEHSADIKNLATALSKAQSEMKPAVFNAKNPFLKSDYADLGSVIEAAREPLATHGLSVSQFPVSDGDKLGIETVLMHASGEWISERAYLPVTDEKGKSSAQVAGSVITYLRRYSLSAVLGIYADADNDGNEAAKLNAVRVQAKVPTLPSKPKPESGPQREPEWLEEIDQAPEVQAGKTLNLPEDHKFDKPQPTNGKGKRAVAASAHWVRIIDRAIKAGYIPDNSTGSGIRLLNVVGAAGIETVNDSHLDDAWTAIKAHYEAKKTQTA